MRILLVVLAGLLLCGGFAGGWLMASPAPSVGAVTIEGNGNTVIAQAGDGNSASVEQARPQRTGNGYDVFFGAAIMLAALFMMGSAFATAHEEARQR